MTRKQKKWVISLGVAAVMVCFAPAANAMHIMEGFLPPSYCVAWGILCIPFLAAGFLSLKKIATQHKKAILVLAMVGAYVFVLSALKIPSVTGSSSHPTGTGLGAILFGPSVMSILGTLVLLFQAILLAHGGLTTLGANVFSMAIAGPFLSYGIYKLSMKCRLSKTVSVFLAACLGDLFTYCITSFQLALAYPSEVGGVLASVTKFLSIFALTQVPLAVIEGILTVLTVSALENYAKPELREIGFLSGGAA